MFCTFFTVLCIEFESYEEKHRNFRFRFRLNAKYGTHGLMKAAARKRHPRFIISRKAIPRLFTYKKRKEERP